ncbi:MAG: SDR family oxidoreductase [Candidatus Cohnella colombiensis]|uniref:SDR family oxidoreductase n=1 Tax=Candidatus Cohnella colombiensis TaxID=3121368 RepID=A0AA95JBY2_9BACL|nr:MAG: SDR family oxidoreductase [Cohnella sp.]
MRTSLRNQVVLITGASSGVGAMTAKLLAERGAIPVLTARSLDKLEQLSLTIASEHAIYKLDVTSPEEVTSVVSQVVQRYGKIDLLLSNAGYGEFIPFQEASLAHFTEMMDVNYMGTVRCVQAVLPSMLKASSGHIVVVGSLAGKVASAKASGYAASKHAVLGFTNALRQELRDTGVCVSAVNPGPIDTPFFDRADPQGGYVNRIRWLMMTPEQVAKAIISVMEKRKAELDIPWRAAVGTKLIQLFPRTIDRLFGRIMNKK